MAAAPGDVAPAPIPPASPAQMFRGDGEMARLMRALDWSRTPLGPVAGWPPSLRTAVGICLTSRYPIVIWWGREYTMLYNDAYRGVMGAKHPQWLGGSGRECWQEIWDVIGPMWESVFRDGEATWSEDLLLPMDRYGYLEETYFTFSYSPILAEAGEVGGIFCACTETTARVINERRLQTLGELGAASVAETRSAEEACELAARTLRAAAADMPFAALYLTDPDGTRASLVATAGIAHGAVGAPAAVDLAVGADDAWPLARVLTTGRTEIVDDLPARFGALPGGPWPEPPRIGVVLPLTAAAAERPVGALVAGMSPRRALDVEYLTFLQLVAGHVSTAIANARAYETERRRAETLAELDRAKTLFFSNVSHEFRTPLTLMLGPLEDALADDAHPLPPAQQARLDLAHRNSLRLLKLVNTLLDFSRIEAGRVEAVYEATDLAGYTAELASAFRSATDRAGLRLEVDCPPLPAPAYVDCDMWEKIVLNLISNAFKFTFEGEIRVELRPVGDHVVLRVGDTGIGIPDQEIGHLFERFHRVRGARGRTQEGTGIGLALVQELVRLHGGSVGVESIPEVGSTFTVVIPAGAAHLPPDRIGGTRHTASTRLGADPFVEEAIRWLPAEARPAELPERAVPTIAPGARILVADDNADMRDYLVHLLRPYATVEAVGDGTAALAAARARVPDLVLSDVMMPGLDGFALLRALRADPRTAPVPVMLLSARAGEESRVEGLHAGADDYLVKPFSARELLARVGAHLGLARVRQAAARHERELREELQALFDAAPVGIWVAHDAACSAVTSNRYAAGLLGLSADAVADTRALAASFRDVRRPGGRPYPRAEHPLRAAGRGRAVEGAELEVERADGTIVQLMGNAVPLRGSDGVARGAIAVMMDVTRLKAAEAAREQLLAREREARADAEAANRAKDEFLAVLSHELRSPLQGIVGWTRVLGTVDLPHDKTARAVDAITRIVQQQTQLVSDLLDVSRIVNDKLTLERKPVDVGALVREGVQQARLGADANRVVITSDVVGSPLVLGDAGRLRQVLDNLLSNAIKFTPKGGTIRVTCRRDDGEVCLEVADDGEGIPPEFVPHLFDRFTQADARRTRHHGGLGLGLAIVRHLVTRHGGTVIADSAGPGRGATFTVRLPALAGDAIRADRLRTNATPAGGLDGLSVLLVEDDDDSREALVLMLERRGAAVIGARSASEAIRALEHGRPHALVSDLGMPGEDGYSLIRRVRSDGTARGVPAVALTGFASGEERERALAAGFDAHLAKPVDPEELVHLLGVLTANR